MLLSRNLYNCTWHVVLISLSLTPEYFFCTIETLQNMPLSHGILQMIDCFTSRAKIRVILTTLCVTPYNNVEASRTKLICQMPNARNSNRSPNPQNCSNNRTVVRINVLIRFPKVNNRARIESGPLYYRDICEGDWTVSWLLTFFSGIS